MNSFQDICQLALKELCRCIKSGDGENAKAFAIVAAICADKARKEAV